jgi:hypothetical protein
MSWTVGQFLRTEHQDQANLIRDYLSAFGPNPDDQMIEGFLTGLRGLAEQQPKNSGQSPKVVYRDPGKALLAYLSELDAPWLARLVAMNLLLHRNTKSGRAWPAQSTTAHLWGISEQSVSRGQKWLETHKVIRLVKAHQHDGTWNATKVFVFTRKTEKRIGLAS